MRWYLNDISAMKIITLISIVKKYCDKNYKKKIHFFYLLRAWAIAFLLTIHTNLAWLADSAYNVSFDMFFL